MFKRFWNWLFGENTIYGDNIEYWKLAMEHGNVEFYDENDVRILEFPEDGNIIAYRAVFKY